MKLTIMQGIPGSGKSYLARKLLKADKDNKTVIVNRDSIRSMLGDYWVPSREDLVTAIENYMVDTSLHVGYSVIIDATNLNPKTIKRFEKIAGENKALVEFVPVKVSIAQAFIQMLWRSLFGGRYIKYSVIKSFYNRYEHIIGV